MKSNFKCITNTDIEMLIDQVDTKSIYETIDRKEKELYKAINDAEFLSSIGLEKAACDEALKAERLMRDIEKLKAAR